MPDKTLYRTFIGSPQPQGAYTNHSTAKISCDLLADSEQSSVKYPPGYCLGRQLLRLSLRSDHLNERMRVIPFSRCTAPEVENSQAQEQSFNLLSPSHLSYPYPFLPRLDRRSLNHPVACMYASWLLEFARTGIFVASNSYTIDSYEV